MDNKLFDSYGQFIGTIPEDCVYECTAPGQDATPIVDHWRRKLDFTVPRRAAIHWLREFGAWPLTSDSYDVGLNDMPDDELAAKVLWLACCDLRETGEWLGLVH